MVGVALHVSAPRARAIDVVAALIQARIPHPSTTHSIPLSSRALGASRVPPDPRRLVTIRATPPPVPSPTFSPLPRPSGWRRLRLPPQHAPRRFHPLGEGAARARLVAAERCPDDPRGDPRARLRRALHERRRRRAPAPATSSASASSSSASPDASPTNTRVTPPLARSSPTSPRKSERSPPRAELRRDQEQTFPVATPRLDTEKRSRRSSAARSSSSPRARFDSPSRFARRWRRYDYAETTRGVGSARRELGTQRPCLFSETRALDEASSDPRGCRLFCDVRGGVGVARHARDAEATRARELALAAREWALLLRGKPGPVELARWSTAVTRRVSTRARRERDGCGGRPRIRDAGRGARFGIGRIEQGIEGIGNIGNVGNIGIGARGARVRATRDGETRVPRGSRAARWRTRRRRDGAASRIPDARAHPRIPRAPRRNSLASMSSLSVQVVSTRSNAPRGRRRRREGPRRTPRRRRTTTGRFVSADVEDAPCDLRVGFGDFGDDDASFALDLLATFVAELRAFVATLVNHDRYGTFACVV